MIIDHQWEQTKSRWLAWWDGEDIGRAGLWVTSRAAAQTDSRDDVEPPPEPADTEQYWTDWDYWAKRVEWERDTTFYGGEAFPSWSTGFPGHLTVATYLGCPITLDRSTGWIEPILSGETWDPDDLRIDERNKWWRVAPGHFARMACECYTGPGRTGDVTYVPHMGAFGGVGDTLSWLRFKGLGCPAPGRISSYLPCWSPDKFYERVYQLPPGEVEHMNNRIVILAKPDLNRRTKAWAG